MFRKLSRLILAFLVCFSITFACLTAFSFTHAKAKTQNNYQTLNNIFSYTSNRFSMPEITPATKEGEVNIELYDTGAPFIVISAFSDSRLKVGVFAGPRVLYYDIPNNGDQRLIPLQFGLETYDVKVYRNKYDTAYELLRFDELQVNNNHIFETYLTPNIIVNYKKEDKAIQKARELTEGLTDQKEKVKTIMEYIFSNMEYDTEKAKNLQNHIFLEEHGTKKYIRDIDETLKTESGVCVDFAVLAASMLRSQGVPTRVIYGYTPRGEYHAWNEVFYTNEGWIPYDVTFMLRTRVFEPISNYGEYKIVYRY